jgi:drug/metabolite transporter (DMT)-like permease
MYYLLLTILCSTSIALILKYSDTKKGEPIVLLAGNYLVASSAATIFLLFNETKSFSIEIMLFGCVLGLLFVVSFYIYAKAISYAGTALATTSSRLSVIIPVVLSIIIFDEEPGLNQLIGFAFTIITFIFFYYSVKENKLDGKSLKKYLGLFGVFIGIGINDFAMKVFKSWRPAEEEPYFILFIFSSAFIYSISYILINKIKIESQTSSWGLVLGVPNVFSTIFLLAALTILPVIIVYPMMNVGIIVLTTLLAFIIWKEKLTRWGILAFIASSLAIYFLSVK